MPPDGGRCAGTSIQGASSEHRRDVLLLQLDSDDGIGWRWGDAGVLQFWIAPADLAAGRFDRVVLTMEGG